MINKYKIAMALSALFAVSLFGACKKQEGMGNSQYGPKVFINSNVGSLETNNAQMLLTHNLKTGMVTASAEFIKFPVHLSQIVDKDVQVTLAVDTSLIAAYNAKYGLNAVAPPNNAYELVNSTITIKAGSSLSADSVYIKLNDPKLIDGQEGNLIPVIIKDAGNISVSSNLNTFYVFFSNQFFNIDTDNNAEPASLFNREQPQWLATVSSNWGKNVAENMLDGDRRTAWCSNRESTFGRVELDMKQENTVTGVQIFPNYIYTSDNSTKIEVLVSVDKVKWTTQGEYFYKGPTVNNANFNNPAIIRNINFVRPVKARYIQLKMYPVGGYTGIGELNVF